MHVLQTVSAGESAKPGLVLRQAPEGAKIRARLLVGKALEHVVDVAKIIARLIERLTERVLFRLRGAGFFQKIFHHTIFVMLRLNHLGRREFNNHWS